MAKSINQEERLLLKLIEKMPVTEEEKTAWADQIRDGNMNEELAETMRQKLSTPPEGEENNTARTRSQVELANLVRRWRLSNQARNFGRR